MYVVEENVESSIQSSQQVLEPLNSITSVDSSYSSYYFVSFITCEFGGGDTAVSLRSNIPSFSWKRSSSHVYAPPTQLLPAPTAVSLVLSHCVLLPEWLSETFTGGEMFLMYGCLRNIPVSCCLYMDIISLIIRNHYPITIRMLDGFKAVVWTFDNPSSLCGWRMNSCSSPVHLFVQHKLTGGKKNTLKE